MASIIPASSQNQFATGVSNAQAKQGSPTVLTLADLTPPSQNPQSLLDNLPLNLVADMRFPADLPLYYMNLEIHKYSRANWLTVGETNIEATIALPLPTNIFDTNTVDFKEEPLGVFGAALDAMNPTNFSSDAGAQSPLPGGINAVTTGINNVIQNPGSAAKSVGASIVGQGAQAAAAQPTSAVLASMGIAINNYLTLMLKGPTYKQHRFTWRFSPRNEDESRQLAAISLALREASAPGLTGDTGSAFFSYPRLIYPKFGYLGQGNDPGSFLYYFKPCFIRNFSFNYTPNGAPAFYSKTQAIEGFQMTLWLQEVEYWLKGSYKNAVQSNGKNTLPDRGDTPAGISDALNIVSGAAAKVTQILSNIVGGPPGII